MSNDFSNERLGTRQADSSCESGEAECTNVHDRAARASVARITRCIIFHFTGTGNNLAIAKKLQSRLGGQITRITRELVDSKPEYSTEICVIILPSYAYGAPRMVKKFLKTAKINAKYCAVLVSYGSAPGAAAAQARKFLRRRGQKTNLTLEIQSVENFIPLFGLDQQKKAKNLIIHDNSTAEAAKKIAAGESNAARKFYPLGSPISYIFTWAMPLLGAMFRITDKCSDCGLCIKLCPANAIAYNKKGKLKVSKRKCEHCQSCLNGCPQKAIKWWRYKESSPRYRHPEVTQEELLCR